MNATEVLNRLRDAFAHVSYPGDDDIVHCEHDRRWGGTLDGPCRECAELVEFFRGAGNSSLDPSELDSLAFGLARFTPEAFCYWLPAFISAALMHPGECGHIEESLEFRFLSLESPEWQRDRFSVLSKAQLEAVAGYFEHRRTPISEWALDLVLRKARASGS